MNLLKMNIRELTEDEALNTIGGDKFLYDVGYFLGRVGRWLGDFGHDFSKSNYLNSGR